MDKNTWLKWGISVSLAMAAGRVTLFGVFYPCPAALLAVTVREGHSGWQMLLLCAGSLWLRRRQSMAVWADIVAVDVVWLFMVLLSRKRPAPVTRALGGALVFSAVKGGVLLRLHMMYRYGIQGMAAEAALIVALSYIIFKLYAFIQLGKAPLAQPEGGLVLMTAGILLLQGIAAPLASFLPEPMNQLSPPGLGAFLFTLWMGYLGGSKEGAAAGVIGGALLSGMGLASPMTTTVLACGGMGSGLCRNETPGLAALVFSATTLFFSFVKRGGALSVPFFIPLLASAVFLLTPGKAVQRIRKTLSVPKEPIGYNLAARQHILKTLDGYQNTFRYLSRAYILQRESFHEDPYIKSGRMIMAYQFKGMADAIDRLAAEVRMPAALAAQKSVRLRLAVGKAGFARDNQVSGDSVYCGEIRKGQYAVALSDGMGNGRRAAEESNLTVQTIYRLLAAGFQPELALHIMNSILLYRAGDEIYSTLDLALFDLYSGELRLYKIGGSLTLLKRGDRVEVVKIPALPMGIVGEIAVPSVSYRLKPGDQIMLLSDGVAEAGRSQGIQWLTEAIGQMKSTDPQTLADLLISKAVKRCGVREKDDMTAVVVVVH